jgi:hypothetical protein
MVRTKIFRAHDEFRDRHGRWVTQYIAASPDGLDVVFTASRLGKLFAQIADKDIDYFELWLVHSAVKVVEEHLLRQGSPLAQAEQLEDGVLLAGQAHWLVVDRDDTGVQVDEKLTGLDRRFGVRSGAPHECPDACDQIATIEGLGEEIVGAETETLDLVVELRKIRDDKGSASADAPRATIAALRDLGFQDASDRGE